MSRRARAILVAALATFREMWRVKKQRPVLAGLVLMPALMLGAMLALPSREAPAQSASPSPAAPPQPERSPTPPAPPGQKTDASRFTAVNPFKVRATRAVETPPPPPPSAAPPPPPQQPAVDLSQKLELLGCFIMGKERYAVILVKQKNQEMVLKEGEAPLPNSRVIKIGSKRVDLVVDGAPGMIELDFLGRKPGDTAYAAAPAPQNPVPFGQPPALPPEPLQGAAADGQARRLARQEVDQHLDNLNLLLTQVNIQPVFQAGQPAGFRLTDIQKGTILDQIGVLDGDTLRFVNGQRIDSVQSAFQLYNILKESTNVEITVIRNTRPVTLRYLIY